MKTLLILSLALVLSAFDNITAAKIFDKLFQTMMNKQDVKVYTSNETYQKVILGAPSLKMTDSCYEADIILVDALNEISKECEEKLFFTTSYFVFKKFDNAVGAFYWDRGHISIKFYKSRLDKYNVKLPHTFTKYLVKEEL